MDQLEKNLEEMTYREAKRVAAQLREQEERKREQRPKESPYELSWERCSMHAIPIASDFAEKIIQSGMKLSNLLDPELVDDLAPEEREGLLIHLLALKKGVEDLIACIERSEPSLKLG
jgi:hypothetical protein